MFGTSQSYYRHNQKHAKKQRENRVDSWQDRSNLGSPDAAGPWETDDELRSQSDETQGHWDERSHASEQAAFEGLPKRGQHAGRGPKGYRRSDARIKEDVSEHLCHDYKLDASDIEVSVEDGVVTLSGTVGSRDEKYHAEDLIAFVPGVQEIYNSLRLRRSTRSEDRQGQHDR